MSIISKMVGDRHSVTI